ncbi:MAG: hypothetical protein OEP95_14980 [Myxococcales bacterium]|nr:hypothetical protein [Myxococcales bacterium]
MAHVKGILLATTVQGIHGALGAGSLKRETVEARLEARDLALLEEKIDPTRWYPVDAIANLTELLAGVLGGPRDLALRRLGEAAVEILRSNGTYRQLAFEPGSLKPGDPAELRSAGRLIASVWPAFYDFGTTRIESEAESAVILLHFEDLGSCPSPVRHTIEGFTARVAQLLSHGALSASFPAAAADHIVIRLG